MLVGKTSELNNQICLPYKLSEHFHGTQSRDQRTREIGVAGMSLTWSWSFLRRRQMDTEALVQFTLTHTRTHIHTHTHARTQARTHARTHARTYTQAHAYAHTRTHTDTSEM